MEFNGPVPGQSLTKEPRNAPWERPPEVVDPEEAIERHIQRFSNPKVMDAILDSIEMGFPVSHITEMLLTGGVTNGIHSIDMSMMIAPVIQEYLVEVLESEGVPFKEFFDADDGKDVKKQMAISQAIQGVKEMPHDEDEMDALDEPLDEETVEEDALDMDEEAPKRGLMSRGDK